jgi:RNA polymerase sigma factor (sigma-70 family)
MRLFGRNSWEKLTDEEIIHLFITQKDNRLIEVLYKRYSHLVFGVCLKYLKHKQNAEDVTLNIFSELSEKFMKHEIQHFKSWLYTSSKNACFMQLRKRKVEFNTLEENTSIFDEEAISSKEVNELKLEKLELAIKELNEGQRFCIEAFYLQKLSYEEITKKTSYSLNEVKSFIQNGKRNLKMILTKRFSEL